MNKDRIKGKAKDIKGRIERQAGEWTGNTDMQIKGAADQVEGKVQNAVGKVKDAGKKMMHEEEKNVRRDEELRRDEEMHRTEPRSRKTA